MKLPLRQKEYAAGAVLAGGAFTHASERRASSGTAGGIRGGTGRPGAAFHMVALSCLRETYGQDEGGLLSVVWREN